MKNRIKVRGEPVSSSSSSSSFSSTSSSSSYSSVSFSFSFSSFFSSFSSSTSSFSFSFFSFSFFFFSFFFFSFFFFSFFFFFFFFSFFFFSFFFFSFFFFSFFFFLSYIYCLFFLIVALVGSLLLDILLAPVGDNVTQLVLPSPRLIAPFFVEDGVGDALERWVPSYNQVAMAELAYYPVRCNLVVLVKESCQLTRRCEIRRSSPSLDLFHLAPCHVKPRLVRDGNDVEPPFSTGNLVKQHPKSFMHLHIPAGSVNPSTRLLLANAG